jgi:hypothetical protein
VRRLLLRAMLLHLQGTGYVDWLYLDEGLRITRGSKGSLFVHVKDNEAKL